MHAYTGASNNLKIAFKSHNYCEVFRNDSSATDLTAMLNEALQYSHFKKAYYSLVKAGAGSRCLTKLFIIHFFICLSHIEHIGRDYIFHRQHSKEEIFSTACFPSPPHTHHKCHSSAQWKHYDILSPFE